MAQSDTDLSNWSEAVDIVKAAPVPWISLFFAYTVLAVCTLGLGLVFAPNVMRMMRDALDEERDPELDFAKMVDTGNLQEDLLGVLLFGGAIGVVSAFVGPLSPLVGILLGYTCPLVADGKPAMESAQTSLKWVLANPVPAGVQGLIANVAIVPAICCFPLFPIVLPVGAIAMWKFYTRHKPELLALTDGGDAP